MKVSFFGFVAAVAVLNLTPNISKAEHSGASSSGGRSGETAAQRCAKRVREAGCILSNNDIQRMDQNVQECKQVTSDSGKTRLEVFLLKNSDKLVVFEVKGPGVPNHGQCPVTKYTVDASGIKDVLIRGNKTWMISNDGQLYVMLPDQSVNEVMNASGKSYSGITKIKGLSDEDDLHIIGKTFDSELSGETLAKRKHRKLDFFKYQTFESLFRDK